MDAIRKLQLELTVSDIRMAIVAAKKLKIKIHVSSCASRPVPPIVTEVLCKERAGR